MLGAQRIYKFLFLLTHLVAICFVGVPAMAATFNLKSFTLDNGLQVVVVPNHRAPIATMIVFYRVGAMDEPPGKSGLAHFLEHLMFKGTKNLLAGEFSTIIARNGGKDNAFTSQDYTGYVTSFTANRLNLILKLEADRMTNLLLTPQDIEPERQVILEERLSRIENNPEAQLSEQATSALYANHPYRIPTIGWAHEINNLTLTDLKSFYNTWYTPNNAVIVITGDNTAEQVKPLVENHFGRLLRQKFPKRTEWREPPRSAKHLLSLSHTRVRQPSWSRRYLAPSYGNDKTNIIYALEVLAEILGGGTTSRLYRQLVVNKGLASYANAWYSGYKRGPGVFGFYGSPRSERHLVKIERAIEAEIEILLNKGVTDEEVEKAIERLQADAVFAQDSLSAPARIVGNALMVGKKLKDIEAWPKNISLVTADAVNKAAHTVLKIAGSVTTRLIPNYRNEK